MSDEMDKHSPGNIYLNIIPKDLRGYRVIDSFDLLYIKYIDKKEIVDNFYSFSLKHFDNYEYNIKIKFPITKSQLRNILTKKNIRIISKIVHPYVRSHLRKFLKINKSVKFVVLDIPLFLENKLNKKSDILIYDKTPKKIIYKRLKKRDNFNKKIIYISSNKYFE